MHYYSLFYTKFYKPCVNCSLVWTKNTPCWKAFEKVLKVKDENSIENLTFGLVDAKNRAFGNNIIFLQQFFFNFGGGTFPVSPLATPLERKID